MDSYFTELLHEKKIVYLMNTEMKELWNGLQLFLLIL